MKPEASMRRSTARNVVIFSLGVVFLGWLGRGLDVLAGEAPGQEGPGMMLWILAPLGVSYILRAFAGDGWKDLGLKPAFQGNSLGYFTSILIYPLCALLVLLIAAGLKIFSLPRISSGLMNEIGTAFAGLLLFQLFQNIFEEFGFRGYLAPKLSRIGLRAFPAHIFVGLIWGVWHLPYLHVVIPYSTESVATLVPRFLAGTIAASIVYGEIRILTGSVWPAVLMQTMGGAFIGGLHAAGFLVSENGMGALFLPVVEGGMMIILFAAAGISLHLYRIRKASERD